MPDSLAHPTSPARRRLAADLARGALRDVQGCPKGHDATICELSDPPRYTACPNPFLGDAVRGRCDAQAARPTVPFAADVREGKRDPLYNAHAYHTKVPHRAIMRYILHYTEPGDVVFDGFCGSGMTGVAALACGDPRAVEALGRSPDVERTRGGPRRAILVDLSPAATFIAAAHTDDVDSQEFLLAAWALLEEVERTHGWMYNTLHQPSEDHIEGACCELRAGRVGQDLPLGRITHTVWSEVFRCPGCGAELVFHDVAADYKAGAVRDSFACTQCDLLLRKASLERVMVESTDAFLQQRVRQAKVVPVLIRYRMGGRRYEKRPDAYDLAVLEAVDAAPAPDPIPLAAFPAGDKTREPIALGLTHVHHLYTRRNLLTLAASVPGARRCGGSVGRRLLMVFTGVAQGDSHLNRYIPRDTSFPFYLLSGTLYVGGLRRENCPLHDLRNKALRRVAKLSELPHGPGAECWVSTQSATDLRQLPDACVDYVFVDPPFGGNLKYSELNFLWEAWLGVFTNAAPEAVQCPTQGKSVDDYAALMTQCFLEFRRILKPGRWMTVEFHNSSRKVWDALHSSLRAAGFAIMEISTLDKRDGTFNQVGGGAAVKQDLIISAYRPDAPLPGEQPLTAPPEGSAWEFVRNRLAELPDGCDERQPHLLFDRMVAHHIRQGMQVPLSAAEFYAGMRERMGVTQGPCLMRRCLRRQDGAWAPD